MSKHASLILVAIIAFVLASLTGCASAKEASDTEDVQAAKGVPAAGRPSGGVHVSFIDVGKGDCILIQADGSSSLIDTGYENTSDEVVSYLRDRGVEHLDCVVITHYDKDHVGGLRTIGESFGIDTVYLPSYLGADKQYRSVKAAVKDLGLPAEQVGKEVTLGLGAGKFTIFPSTLAYVPDANGDEGNDNDLSLVASLTYGDDSYLFAGDLEKEGISAYLRAGHGGFDVLKMPHHGQGSSNTDDLLADVNPKVVVITDSADDPADKKTLKLLKKTGAEVYRTGTEGIVVVESDGSGRYEVSTDED